MIAFRDEIRPADLETIREIVLSTGFFSAEEVAVAVELADERLRRGADSGYHFLFAEAGGEVLGYSCFGPIPLTRSSFDLYWIVVRGSRRGGGVGRRLLEATERGATALGATALYAETSGRAQYAPTRGFYLGSGYGQAARFADFYAPGDDKVVLVKSLTP